MKKLIDRIIELLIKKLINVVEELLNADLDGDGDINDKPKIK